MNESTIYIFDPASIAFHRLVGSVLICVVVLVSAALIFRFGWRSVWAVGAAAVVLPTIVVFLASKFSGAPSNTTIPDVEFVLEVTLPLAIIVVPAAVVGAMLGAILGWLYRRGTN